MYYLIMTGWREEWTTEFMTEFGCDVNIKSTLDEFLCKTWAGSLLTCLSPHWEVKDSTFLPS